MSSAFHHDDSGKEIVERGNSRFVKTHGVIYELKDGATAVEFDANHHPVNATKPFDLPSLKVFSELF